ncbi:hypothetical protein BGZ61DRAFT_549741, partial [Ilyonectria robusta]|uniref:uncharacterized protein n=1 Tax=Ilyonectria robusta TaxID=1079257 RepID=UPI001E8ECAAE
MLKRSKVYYKLIQIESHKTGVNIMLNILVLAITTRKEIKQDKKTDIHLLVQQSENLAFTAHQSLVDLSETQDQYLNIDAEKPNHLSSDQKNEAISQLQLQVSRQRSNDTADWLFDLVFLPYAQSCVDPSDQNSTNLPSNSTMSDIDEDPQEQSSTNECSTGKSAVIRDPSAMQIALYNPGAASSLVKELLADWTVLTEKEIESVTSDSQSSEQEEAKTSNESEKTKEFIYFEDAVGRRYTFPFYRVKSYQVS